MRHFFISLMAGLAMNAILLAGALGLGRSGEEGDQGVGDLPLGAGPPRVQVEYKSPVVYVSWSPNGKWLAVGTKDGTIHLTEAATGKKIHVITTTTNTNTNIVPMAFSPDGKALAVCYSGQSIDIWNVAAATKERNLGGSSASLKTQHLAFTSDGQTVRGSALPRRAGEKHVGESALFDVPSSIRADTASAHTGCQRGFLLIRTE